MKAIVLQGDKKASLVTDRAVPKLRPGYVLVDVKAVALNPTDWKHIDFINTPGSLSGCDYAGVVAEVGPGVNKQWKKGDRICGFTHGGNSLQSEDGAFAEHIVSKADVQYRIPDSWSFEDAATLGVAIVTCGQGLYQQMGLNWPDNPTTSGENILIYGGSSAMGTMGIQLAKLSGYTVITTCSPKNFDLVKSLGATAAFDYKDPECVEQIKKFTNNNLKFVWDTIAVKSSLELCEKVISPGGTYGRILAGKMERDDVKTTFSLGYTAVGEPVTKANWKYSAEDVAPDFEFMTRWVKVADQLLADNKVRPHPKKVGHGLENLLDGADLMRHDKVSGQKLVYTV